MVVSNQTKCVKCSYPGKGPIQENASSVLSESELFFPNWGSTLACSPSQEQWQVKVYSDPKVHMATDPGERLWLRGNASQGGEDKK